jgi:hypothetical protein
MLSAARNVATADKYSVACAAFNTPFGTRFR